MASLIPKAAGLLAIAAGATGFACANTPQDGPIAPTPSSGGSGASGGAPSAGGSVNTTAGSAGSTASGGAPPTAGAGGAASGASGSAGSAGTPSCEELGSPGRTGSQCDPGTEDNGTRQQDPPPTGTPPEAITPGAGSLSALAYYLSSLYGYNFPYRVYVPPQYQIGKPAALMIFQDGVGNYINNFHAPNVINALIAAGEMPVTIVAFIDPGAERSVEYDSMDDKYARFVLEEFIPDVVEPAYDIVDDPNGWAIGGHSSGGICAFTVGWHYPDKFRKIMTHNGSFVDIRGGSAYPSMITSEPAKPLRVTMLSGTGDLTGRGGWFPANDAFAEALSQAGYAYRYLRGTGTHDPSPWATYDFPDALRWLWRAYTLPHYAN